MTKRTGVPSRDLRRMKNNFLDILEVADDGSPWLFRMLANTEMDRTDDYDLGVQLRAEVNNEVVAEIADAGGRGTVGKAVDTNRVGMCEIEFMLEGTKGGRQFVIDMQKAEIETLKHQLEEARKHERQDIG